jgi:hypothetical protein
MLMAWKWNNGTASLEMPSTASPQLRLTAGTDHSPHPVPNISPTEAYCTLGVYIFPSGSMKKAQEILLSYATDYVSSVVGSTFTQEEAYTSFTMVFFPKVIFPLPVLTLTEKQCNLIQSPALQAVLPKMH